MCRALFSLWRNIPPMLAALFASLHVLALAIGLGAVFARGRALRALVRGDGKLEAVFFADNFWGLAALLWIGSGLARLFGQLDKGLDFYVFNGLFWVKMGLFALVFALEIAPMVSLIRWRAALRKGGSPDTRRAPLLVRLNDAEVALVLVIAFVAPMMSRGLWLLT